jgi:hypothetical protein
MMDELNGDRRGMTMERKIQTKLKCLLTFRLKLYINILMTFTGMHHGKRNLMLSMNC